MDDNVFLPEGELNIFADYLNVKKDLSLTFYYINLMLPLFVAVIISNVSIGYFFPTFKGVYDQQNYSSFAENLKLVRTFLNFLVYFFALIFIYLLPLMKVGESIGMGSYNGVYNNLLPLIILNLVLISIFLVANSFTKFNYSDGGYFYCKIVKNSDNNMDSDQGTCERTNWQTSRDALLCSISDFVSNMSVFSFTTSTPGVLGPFIPLLLFGSVILGGILKHIYLK